MMELKCAVFVLLCAAAADDKKAESTTGEVFIAPSLRAFDKDSKDTDQKNFATAQESHLGRPVLVTLLRDGKVIKQEEFEISKNGRSFTPIRSVPFGSYTVKFEAPGIQTVVKKGIVVSGTSDPSVIADLTAGKGVRHIEYGQEGDPLADLIARVKKLEAEIAALKK
jgi:hypothetical protein